MINLELKLLLARLNAYCKKSLETAAGLCVSRTNYEVTIEHLLLAMADDTERDFQLILRHYGIAPEHVKRALQRDVEAMKTGNGGRPVFSPQLVEWFSNAWLFASVEIGLGQIRSGVLVATLLADTTRYRSGGFSELLSGINADDLRRNLQDIVATSREEAGALGVSAAQGGGAAEPGPEAGEDTALGRFCINFTREARAGRIDPVFARDREMRQMVDILGRRRKNNPIAVGEAGVGKTAIIEGLALKIAQGDVPEFIQNVELFSLDLGLLQAGAGVKGEFENRLKGVIDEVKASPTPIIMFIDEAHTLIGAGGAAGGSDAANLLKPALARGELRTIAATTWAEYKKYFERDPALARRFQLVKLDEPSPEDAVTILRGIRGIYEKSHGVYIRDDAVDAAAKLSARYISGRQLPDKAVDVLDTAAARVKLSLTAKPVLIDDAERRIATLRRELDAVNRDLANDNLTGGDMVEELETEISDIEQELETLNERWNREKSLVDRILELRQTINQANGEDVAEPAETDETPDDAASVDTEGAVDDAQPEAEEATATAAQANLDLDALWSEIKAARSDLAVVQDREPLMHYEVTQDSVAQTIADWTGIPLGSMIRDEAAQILTFSDDMQQRIKGQDHAINALDEGMRAAKAGLNNPDAPMGVFLFVGPSGVGKTETATAIADLLFGGERFMVSINMSEFQEKHTVSRLVGSPPGYVGYGEGGVLTEAVRQRPYSVVLLDEVEKADLEVMNLFYQVFDKGVLSDGEGRVINFKNTIVLMTSNLATDVLTEMGLRDPKPSMAELSEAIRPTLNHHFKPALLARMQVVPFYPLHGDVMHDIVRLKLGKVGKRMAESQKMSFDYTDAVVKQIAARCTEVETGARNIDHIINRTLLPEISTEILTRLSDEVEAAGLTIDIGDGGRFSYEFATTET
jgi:type VI secretion system protein VasG